MLILQIIVAATSGRDDKELNALIGWPLPILYILHHMSVAMQDWTKNIPELLWHEFNYLNVTQFVKMILPSG